MSFGQNDTIAFGNDDAPVQVMGEPQNPILASERIGQAFDMSVQSQIPLNESRAIMDTLEPIESQKTGVVARVGKQLYNSTIASIANTLGKSDYSGVEIRAYELLNQWQKETGNRLDDDLFDEQFRDWAQQLTLPPETREESYLKNEPQYEPPVTQNPFALDVSDPEWAGDKIIDAFSGVVGFVAEIALLKRVAPSMPVPAVWETVNLASGGSPGTGAAMQVTLGKINQVLPGAGILPAAGRATAASSLFGTATYLGGGDTTDILISMGIPFAFEGLGLTQQKWNQYKNKTSIIKALQKKAPALAAKSEAEIDAAISDIIPNIETKGSGGAGETRERGFVSSVKEKNPNLKPEGEYKVRSTDDLAMKARNLIKQDLAQAERIAKTGTDQIAVATASELIKYYETKAIEAVEEPVKMVFYDKAADIATVIAPKLTELGRAVQAASILSRMTPEGQVRFAAREIQKYNESIGKRRIDFRKRIPDLTGEQAKFITEEMKAIDGLTGEPKAMRFQKLQNYISDLVPAELSDKIITTWKAGLLTGIKTTGLNLAANTAFAKSEIIKDIPATMVDKVVSLATGRRAVAFTAKGAPSGAVEGFKKGYRYIVTGYDERNIGTKLDWKRVNFGKGKAAKALQTYTDTVFHLLGAEDQPFYYAAKTRSLYEQAKVSAINKGLKGKAAQSHIDKLIQNPTEDMVKYAAKDAEVAVFQNKTVLADVGRAIQKLPGGEIVVPFSRTPSAVAMEILDYSPIGIAKTIITNIGKGNFDQRAFSQGIGRGLTGTAVLYIGSQFYDSDMITLDRPKTETERRLWELEGRIPNSIKIDGKWRSVQALGPEGNLLIIGGHFKRAFEDKGTPTGAMVEALSGSAKSFTEQTFLQGVNQFVSALSNPERSAPSIVGSTVSSIIPTIVGDIAKATDDTERLAAGVTDRLVAKIPGARQTLPPRINALGEEIKPTGNPLEIMLDPTRPSKEISNPIVDELRRLFDEGYSVTPTLLGDKAGYDVLTPQENTELWKRSGTLIKETLEKLVGTPNYDKLPDRTKAKLIDQIVDTSKKAAKIEVIAKKLNGLKGNELLTKLIELKEAGLATQDIVPITKDESVDIQKMLGMTIE